MSLLLLLPAAASAADEARVLVQVTISESGDDEMVARLEQAARCQPEALGGPGAVPVAVWALDDTPWLSVLSSPSILTLDGQPAQVRMGGAGASTELAVTPVLDGDAIRLAADLSVETPQATTAGSAELVVASGQHAVWPVDDLIVIIGAHVVGQDEEVADIRAEQEQLWEDFMAPVPRGSRARRRAVDAALEACP